MGDQFIVWPIGAGGWTQINEMVYLDRHPEIIANMDYFAWEYMRGGLSASTPWAGEYVFPSRRPILASLYVMRRYILPHLLVFNFGSELPVTGTADEKNIDRFDRTVRSLKYVDDLPHRGLIWLYPTVTQLREARAGKDWLPERETIEKIAKKYKIQTLDVAADPNWNESLYRDDGVHPTVEGNNVLASILTSAIQKNGFPPLPAKSAAPANRQ